ncbi:chemokine (C-C motif) ligand 34b, duplicate 4 [Sebastes umbrosus]|uniref:chemokine (C-C motif) ligand 34b, duplicate 4 n=1 Tax=Sebastes umbrosus TaxID=72105 RepID=UPI0018A04686|nr:chemokine (C-C motif) ligand 34b, duplicate 4 [Sebastes umbrosus]
MSLRIVSITLLLISGCLYFSSAAGRYPDRYFACCTAVTTKDISHDVIGNTYRAQSAKNRCVEAIIFTTAQGKVCVDPNAEWVQTLTANMRKSV